MEVEYKCDLRDYEEALVTRETKPLGRKMLGSVIGGLVVLFGIIILTALGLSQGAAVLSGLVFWNILVLICRFVVRPVWIGRDFRKHPNFSLAAHLVIDDEGLHSKSEIGQADKKWPAYTKYRETPNLFILHLGARSFEVVPKRAFLGSQLDEFRQLLRQKLPSTEVGA
ncbi:MAG: YcxB family protein [Terriglobales bacterium]